MNKYLKKMIIIGVCALIILIVGIMSVGVVPTNHTGIWKRMGVVQNESITEGWHLIIPFVDDIETMSNLVQTTSVFSSQTASNATTKETAETKDQQLIMSYEFEVQYQLIPEMSFIVYKNYGREYKRVLIDANIIPIIKQAFAAYNSEDITTNKENIANYVRKQLSEFVSEYGLNIIRVNFKSYDFTDEYNAILEERAALKAQVINEELRQNQERVSAQTEYDVAVKRAEQEAETKRIAADNAKAVALVEAERDKETAIIQANANAEAAKIKADNQAYVTTTVANADKEARLAAAEALKAELDAQASGLTELVVQKMFIERWNGELIPSFGGGSTLNIANLTDIYKQYLGIGSSDVE